MSSPAKFSTQKSSDGKTTFIVGPFDLDISINTDDVDMKYVKPQIKQLVQILNQHWIDPS